MAQPRKGDYGSVLRIKVKQQDGNPFNASGMTTKTLKLRPPSGTVIERVASFESTGVDGIFRYTWADGDLSESGPWAGQLLMVGPSSRFHTDEFSIVVGENLS